MDRIIRRRIDDHDLTQAIDLHVLASKKLKMLREEHQALLDAGKKTAAKAVLRRAERVETVIRALQVQVKQSPGS